MSVFSSLRKTVQNKINDLSDAVYGVMPSPVQAVADAVGKPIAETANNLGKWIDDHISDGVKDAATAAFGVPSAIAGGATAINALSSNMDKGLVNSTVGSVVNGVKQALQTPVGEVAAPFVAGSSAGAAAGAGTAAAASAPSVASTLGAIGAAVAPSVIQAGASMAGAIDYNQTMRDTNKETNQTNMAIANQNLGFQRSVLDYNKQLQQQIFNREDTSYQRTVADMRAAGLSPLMMQGTNGAGEAIALTAPNNSYQHTPLSDYKSPIDAFASLNPIGFLSSLEDLKAKRLQNQLASDTYDYSKAKIKAESLLSQYSQMDASRREKFNSAFNLNSSMSEKEKMAVIISKLLGTPLLNKDGSPNMNLGDDLDKLLDRISGSSPVKAAIDALSSSSKSGKPSKVTASSPKNQRLKVAPRSNSSKSEPNWHEKRGETWVRNR